MPRYEVQIRQIEKYSLKILAEDEEEAQDIAFEMLENASNKSKYHDDSDSESEAYEIE